MRILGIDPGTAIVGFSVIEVDSGNQAKLLEYGCIRTKANQKNHLRLNQIAKDLETILAQWKPNIAAVEKLYFQTNVKTAMSVSEARGVIMHKISEKGLEIAEYTPLEIKSAITGYGKADKKMIQEMVRLILNLKQVPKPDDAADAIAIALCLANQLNIRNQAAKNYA